LQVETKNEYYFNHFNITALENKNPRPEIQI
jgi:hypothetical protein